MLDFKMTIEQIQSEAAARVAELQRTQAEYEAKLAQLVESETAREQRLRIELERQAILAQMDTVLAFWTARFDQRAAELDSWRVDAHSLINAAMAIHEEQMRHQAGLERMIETFATDMRAFAAGFSNQQEFVLHLSKLIENLSNRCETRLSLPLDTRKRFDISNHGFYMPVLGDMRKHSMNRALRKPMPPASMATAETLPPESIETEPATMATIEPDAQPVTTEPKKTGLTRRRKRR